MNSIARLTRLPVKISCRTLRTTSVLGSTSQVPQTHNPDVYNIPLRPATMDDLMEPYGPWKVAYEAERRRANKALILGLLCITATTIISIQSGVYDPLIMPNLDNIMEETESFHSDKEGRITV